MKKNVKRVEKKIKKAASGLWMERLGHFGYATKGMVYIIVGALATLAAFGLGGETTDVRGALQEIEKNPFGRVALIAVAFGLIGYVLWRWIQALADTERKGTKLKGVCIRIGYFVSGAVYAGMALTAARILFADEEPQSSSRTQETWIARVLSLPFGRTLVVIAGGCVIGFGLYQIFKAYKAKFRKHLKLGELRGAKDTWTTWSGRFGYAARGVVFCIIGFFIVRAALDFNPTEAKGLDEALGTLAQHYYGSWILGIVAVGLIVYGFYMIIEARYRRMIND